MFKGSSCQAGNVALISAPSVRPVGLGRVWGGSLFGGLATSFARSVSSRSVGFDNVPQLKTDRVTAGWRRLLERRPRANVSVGISGRPLWEYSCHEQPRYQIKVFAVCASAPCLPIAVARCVPILRWWSSLRDTWRRPPTVKLGHRTAHDAKCRFFQPRFGSTKPNILSQMLDEVSRPCSQRRSPGVLRGKKT